MKPQMNTDQCSSVVSLATAVACQGHTGNSGCGRLCPDNIFLRGGHTIGQRPYCTRLFALGGSRDWDHDPAAARHPGPPRSGERSAWIFHVLLFSARRARLSRRL